MIAFEDFGNLFSRDKISVIKSYTISNSKSKAPVLCC